MTAIGGGAGGIRPLELVIDCTDHETLERFWTQALGWESRRLNEQYVAIVPPERGPMPILLQKVPEPKTVKNRVHIDFAAEDMAAEVERLRGLGATWIAERQLFGPPGWTVMADPEGNEFCVAGRPTPPADGSGA